MSSTRKRLLVYFKILSTLVWPGVCKVTTDVLHSTSSRVGCAMSDSIPREEVIDMLTHINMLLLAHQDQDAWSYTHVLLKAIKDGEY